MSEENIAKKPYCIDAPIHKVQTIEYDGDTGYLFRHDFTRLDGSSLPLIKQREKENVRMAERMTKGRVRPRAEQIKGDAIMYRGIVQGGGYRLASLTAVADEGLILPAHRGLYSFEEETKQWVPGWIELDKNVCLTFTPEKMHDAIERYLAFFGKYLAGEGIDFMFEKGGTMKIRLNVGDREDPPYSLLFEMRRPDSKRRTKFRDDFAYIIEHTKGELGKVETITNIEQGIGVFDEYFSTMPTDPDYNPIVFRGEVKSVQDALASGEEPAKPPSVTSDNENVELKPYVESLKADLMRTMNPYMKIEVAATMITSFSQTDRES